MIQKILVRRVFSISVILLIGSSISNGRHQLEKCIFGCKHNIYVKWMYMRYYFTGLRNRDLNARDSLRFSSKHNVFFTFKDCKGAMDFEEHYYDTIIIGSMIQGELKDSCESFMRNKEHQACYEPEVHGDIKYYYKNELKRTISYSNGKLTSSKSSK